MATEVEVIAAALADKSVVRNLLELYLHDFSEMTASDESYFAELRYSHDY